MLAMLQASLRKMDTAEKSAAPVAPLTNDETLRYSRHLILPEVGVEGQLKLKQARVLCVGAGGLGSPVALYLAAAGVGTLGIVDFDVVDVTNLQRQVLHGTGTLDARSWIQLRSASQPSIPTSRSGGLRRVLPVATRWM